MTKFWGKHHPDSFWSGSRINNPDALVERVRQMMADGADAIDIGGCSTCPAVLSPPKNRDGASHGDLRF